MMVYKCDRCGRIHYEHPEMVNNIALLGNDMHGDQDECDLCENCYASLVEWYMSRHEVRNVLFDTALMSELNDQMKAHGATEEEFRKVYDGETHIRRMIEKYMIGEDDSVSKDISKARKLYADGKSLDEIAKELGYDKEWIRSNYDNISSDELKE